MDAVRHSPATGKETRGSTVTDRGAVLEAINEPRPGASVNADGWRFRCPKGHQHLRWCSRQRVECRTCGDPYRDYATEEIVDGVTGGTLEAFLQEADL